MRLGAICIRAQLTQIRHQHFDVARQAPAITDEIEELAQLGIFQTDLPQMPERCFDLSELSISVNEGFIRSVAIANEQHVRRPGIAGIIFSRWQSAPDSFILDAADFDRTYDAHW
jgi:hypothetical protein